MPFPWAALAAFAPSLLGGMFQRGDPTEKLRRELMRLYAPGNIANATNTFYNQFLQSPAFSAAQGQIAAGTNTLTNQLQRSLGARGLTTSGIGAVAPGLARSTAGFNLAGLQSSAYQDALQRAMQAIQGQASGLTGLGPSPNYTNQLFGAGMDFFGPFFAEWIKSLGKGTVYPATPRGGYPTPSYGPRI